MKLIEYNVISLYPSNLLVNGDQMTQLIANPLMPEYELEIGEVIRETVVINQNGSVVTRLELAVTFNGQSQFNIFTFPTNDSVLEINGVTYYPNLDYFIDISGGNVKLYWLDSFPLETTDELFLVKF